MPVSGLFHVAIKANDLDATVRFYTEVLGLHSVARPDFGYPGAWLATPGGASIIHIYAGGAALGDDGRAPYGTSAIDHVSITATDFHGFIRKFKEHGLDWREFNIPEARLWQLFVYDPSGVQLEITFDASKESAPEPDVKNRGYVAGSLSSSGLNLPDAVLTARTPTAAEHLRARPLRTQTTRLQ